MLMRPALRKLVLPVPVTATVGWIGSVVAYVAIVLALLASRDVTTVRAAYFAMNVLAWYVIVPLSGGSLLTGVVQSVGTTWGLIRHWWVIYKLVLTVLATFVLLEYTQSLGQ